MSLTARTSECGPGFTLQIGTFQGPLDLLLALIERRELDITTVALAQVADLFMAHVHQLDEIDPDVLTEFIAVAAKLLLIKSSVLLPSSNAEGPEDVDDPTDLTERLREYQSIRGAAQSLAEREAAGMRSFSRPAPLTPPDPPAIRDAGAPDDLLRALERIAALAVARQPEQPVERQEFSIGEKIEMLRSRLSGAEPISFAGLLLGKSRPEVVATFLAVLELLRLGEIEASQPRHFDDIALTRA